MKKLTLAFLSIGLTACTGWAPVDNVNVADYQDLPSMLEAEFSDPLFVQVDTNNIHGLKSLPPSNEKIFLKPVSAFKGLCEQQGGLLKQEATIGNEINFITESGAKFFKDNTGIFICEGGNAGLWGGQIRIINPRYSNPSVRVVNVSAFNAVEYFDEIQRRKLAKAAEEARIAEEKRKEEEQLIAMAKKALETEKLLKEAKKVFVERSKHKKSVGMTVCSLANSIGIVREITKDHLRLFVFAKQMSAKNAYLFQPNIGKFPVTGVDKDIWDVPDNWAECPYQVRQKFY